MVDAPTHPGPPPARHEGRTAMAMWRGQWDAYQRWVADQTPQLAPVAELQEEDARWRPSGWAWRTRTCRVNVPDDRARGPMPAWTNPHRVCEVPAVAYVEVVNSQGYVQWHGVCARHAGAAFGMDRGWRWAHDASMVAMTSDDDRESWLAMYALGWTP